MLALFEDPNRMSKISRKDISGRVILPHQSSWYIVDTPLISLPQFRSLTGHWEVAWCSPSLVGDLPLVADLLEEVRNGSLLLGAGVRLLSGEGQHPPHGPPLGSLEPFPLGIPLSLLP